MSKSDHVAFSDLSDGDVFRFLPSHTRYVKLGPDRAMKIWECHWRELGQRCRVDYRTMTIPIYRRGCSDSRSAAAGNCHDEQKIIDAVGRAFKKQMVSVIEKLIDSLDDNP